MLAFPLLSREKIDQGSNLFECYRAANAKINAHKIFRQMLSGPLPELSAANASHPISHSDDYIHIIHQDALFIPFFRRNLNFSNCFGQMDFTALINLLQMVINGRYINSKQFRHSFLRNLLAVLLEIESILLNRVCASFILLFFVFLFCCFVCFM